MSALDAFRRQSSDSRLAKLRYFIREMAKWDSRSITFRRDGRWNVTLGDGCDGWLKPRDPVEVAAWAEFGPRIEDLHKDISAWLAAEYERIASNG